MMRVKLPISPDEEGKQLEPSTVNMDYVVDHREYKNKDNKPQTILFFSKDVHRKQLIVDVDVKSIDKLLGAINLLKEDE